MAEYRVTVWASYETIVAASSEDEANNKAIDECPFPYADYCETEIME